MSTTAKAMSVARTAEPSAFWDRLGPRGFGRAGRPNGTDAAVGEAGDRGLRVADVEFDAAVVHGHDVDGDAAGDDLSIGSDPAEGEDGNFGSGCGQERGSRSDCERRSSSAIRSA